jgi:hypothetical protein
MHTFGGFYVVVGCGQLYRAALENSHISDSIFNVEALQLRIDVGYGRAGLERIADSGDI